MLEQFSFTVCLLGASELFRAFFFFKIKGHPDKKFQPIPTPFFIGTALFVASPRSRAFPNATAGFSLQSLVRSARVYRELS